MIEMSRISRIKRCLPLLAIAILLVSAVSPAMAEPPVQPQRSVAPAGGTASPGPGPVHAGNGTINVTSAPPTLSGPVKIGNLHAPPAISRNLTQPIKKQVNDAWLNLAKKGAGIKINQIINQIELYWKKITSSSLSNDQKSGIGGLVDTNIAWFRQQDANIQAAVDINAVQGLMAQVDQQAESLKVNMRKDAGILACDGLDTRIATARNVSTVVADKIATLRTRGNKTAPLEEKLADYKAHLDAASRYSDAARAAFEGITSADGVNGGFNEGYRQIGLADREMNKVYADLKYVFKWYLQSSRT